jgi:serine/threonine protein kinase
MTLSVGTRLGPYEILFLIGAGGMGEVYRARDPRIGREVAIKILPETFSKNEERLRRFEQEARTAGVLNHPNILAVYDVGTENGAPYIVSELLEGETLRHKLRNGPLSTRKTIEYALQIARGLAAAHEKGITHRDLKPDNLFATRDGRIKILDFGLAKLTETISTPQDDSTFPTKSNPYVVLGTVGYMSPEQVRGLPVDSRSDIFSFGSTLYEMFTGKRAFSGATPADTASAILQKDPPDLTQANSEVLPAAERIVRHCLEKDAEHRFQSAKDVAFALEGLSGVSDTDVIRIAMPRDSGRSALRKRLWMIVAIVSALFGITALLLSKRSPAMNAQERLLQLSITAPAGTILSGWPVISPDGRKIIFTATDAGGRDYLWLRALDSPDSRQLPGTEDAHHPFWSPDGKWIGFFAPGKMKKLQMPDGPVQILCDVSDPRGGTWSQDGTILFAPNAGQGFYTIPSTGGIPVVTTQLDHSRGESSHRWPIFLPNGRDYLFYIFHGTDLRSDGIYLGSLGSNTKKLIVPAGTGATYALPGYLLFQDETILMAQPFDLKQNRLSGMPIGLTNQLVADIGYAGTYGFSAVSDMIACVRGDLNSRLTVIDRTGKKIREFGDPRLYISATLSLDGKKVVSSVQAGLAAAAPADLWIIDSQSGNSSRFTFGTGNVQPVWSPDGTKIIYSAFHTGTYNLYMKNASGGEEQVVLKTENWAFPDDWSNDNRFLLFDEIDTKTNYDLWILPLSGSKAPYPLLNSPALESQGRFSPDGKYVSYTSDETGRPEVYVQRFPDAASGKWQISSGGAAMASWSKDGKELFYLTLDKKFMVVDVKAGFQSASSQVLFSNVPFSVVPSQTIQYVVNSDSQSFIIIKQEADRSTASITVISNWQNFLKK